MWDGASLSLGECLGLVVDSWVFDLVRLDLVAGVAEETEGLEGEEALAGLVLGPGFKYWKRVDCTDVFSCCLVS